MGPPEAYCAARDDFWKNVSLNKSPPWKSIQIGGPPWRHEDTNRGRSLLPQHVLNGRLGEFQRQHGPCGEDEYLSPPTGIETQKVLHVVSSLHRLRCTCSLKLELFGNKILRKIFGTWKDGVWNLEWSAIESKARASPSSE